VFFLKSQRDAFLLGGVLQGLQLVFGGDDAIQSKGLINALYL
jgi:hypothetical protein